jgi:O-antigen/teichoic acid export membrane protein
MKSLKRWSFAPIIQNFFNLGVFQAAGILLQLILIPIISRKYGIAVFGQVALVASFAAFAGVVTNYGTSQTGIKEVANHLTDRVHLSKLFFKILFFRMLVAAFFLPVILWMIFFPANQFNWIWAGAIPLILAEVFNPLYFLIGKEKIQWISWGNMVVKMLVLLFILAVPMPTQPAAWINVAIGMPMLVYYILIGIYIHYKESLSIIAPSKKSLIELAKDNFYIMFNGTAVSLQQSVFLFAIANYVSANTLGSYALVDKLLGACRQLVSAFSTAVYPQAARLYQQSADSWLQFRKSLQKIYGAAFGVSALLIFFGAKYIVLFTTKKDDPGTELFVQMFCLAPLLLALNANNVLTLLLEKRYQPLFTISILILVATFLISFALVQFSDPHVLGWYPIAIEVSCLLIYTAFTKKKKSNVP